MSEVKTTLLSVFSLNVNKSLANLVHHLCGPLQGPRAPRHLPGLPLISYATAGNIFIPRWYLAGECHSAMVRSVRGWVCCVWYELFLSSLYYVSERWCTLSADFCTEITVIVSLQTLNVNYCQLPPCQHSDPQHGLLSAPTPTCFTNNFCQQFLLMSMSSQHWVMLLCIAGIVSGVDTARCQWCWNWLRWPAEI